MTYEQATIARCTRDGHVLWPHVARQLGLSEPTARARFDPTYLKPYVAVCIRESAPPVEPLRCGAPQTPGLVQRIITAIGEGPTVLSVIVERVGAPRSTIVTRLTDMKAKGLVTHIKNKRAWGPGTVIWRGE